MQRRTSDPNTGMVSGWTSLSGTTAASYTDTPDVKAGVGVQYRVRAANGTLTSAWKQSAWVYRAGGVYVSFDGRVVFGTVYAAGPQRAKGVWAGSRTNQPGESISAGEK